MRIGQSGEERKRRCSGVLQQTPASRRGQKAEGGQGGLGRELIVKERVPGGSTRSSVAFFIAAQQQRRNGGRHGAARWRYEKGWVGTRRRGERGRRP
jgi:hypothetical protein